MRRSVCFSRFVSVVLGALLVAGGLSGCGSEQDPAAGGAQRLESPATVKHRFGSTTIDRVPKRVVTIDLQWTDTMLAMGVKPVGYTVDSLMPKSRVPWQALPAGSTALPLDDGVPVEQIIALNPDLIVGSFSITDKETYELLSARAPTIAGPPSGDAVTPWQDLVRTAGAILAEKDKAEQVIDSVAKAVSGAAREFPGLKGKTFSLAQYVVGDSMYIVANEKDGSSLLFRRLGMTLYPRVLREGRRTGKTRVNVSTERADLLRADLLTFLVNGGDKSDLTDIPEFDQLPGTVAVLDYPTVVGLNTPSPLSIPYALDQIRPYLKDAANKAGA
ncbi:MAG: ABC transporter substrate-binding protein [Pseudonocardiaceae bacterium]|nr:ABC transporter substrate-binding protein [Pseudonocardiaceae bacterium]